MPSRDLNYRIKSSADVSGYTKATKALNRLAKATIETDIALKRQARAQAVATRRLEALSLGYTQVEKRAVRSEKAVRRHTRAAKVATKELAALNMIVRRLLVGWASLYVMLEAKRGFQAAVGRAIEFNKQLEQSRLGIAALITASARIEDSFGASLSTAESFAAAQKEARRQVELLRRDALATEATYEQLLETFQVAVAPGLAGGMNLDEIRKFSLRISQAASALAMPQRQLAEEIRSILQGSIRVQNTRIAAALNITNEDVRKWKTMGTLADNLFKRFGAFAESGKRLRDTFAGLVGRVSDALQQLAGTAGKGFFDEIKSSLKDVFTLVVDISNNGVLIRPEVVTLAKTFFDHIKNVLIYFKQILKEFDKARVEDLLNSIGSVIETLGKLFIDVGRGVGRAFMTIGRLVNLFTGLSEKAKGAGEAIGNMVSLLTEILVLRGALSGIIKIFGAIQVAITFTNKALITMRASALSLSGIFLKMGLPLIAVVLLAKEIAKAFNELNGTKFTFLTQLLSGFQMLSNLLKGVWNNVKSLFGLFSALGVSIKSSLVVAFRAVKSAAMRFVKLWYDFMYEVSSYRGDVEATQKYDKLAFEAEKAIDSADSYLKKSTDQWSKEISDAWTDGFNQIKYGWKQITFEDLTKGVNDILEQGGKEAGKKWLNGVMSEISGFGVGGIGKILEDALGLSPNKVNAALAQTGQVSKKSVTNIAPNYSAKIQEIQNKMKPLTQLLDRQLKTHEDIKAAYDGRIAQLEADIRGHQELINQGINVKENEAVILGYQEQINALKQEERILIYQSNQALDQTKAKMALITAETEGGWRNTLNAIVADLKTKVPTEVQTAIKVVGSAIDSFASTISNAIIDAFDPNKKGGIKEKFAQFLKGLAQMIMQQLMKIAMMKAAISVGLMAAGGAHSGGRIGNRRGAPSPAHLLAPQGLAAGGRPEGLHHTDTIPIWAAPGEFMMRVDAVKKYGASVMQAINQGLVDPVALRSIAGAFRSPSRKMPKTRGFAEGGQVPQGIESGSEVPTPAVVVASNESMDRLLSGGKQAMISFIADNADDIRQILR